MKKVISIFIIAASIYSCNRVEDKAKQAINKGGEVVGKSASEFVNGVSEGVDKTMECELKLSDAIIKKGIKTGKYTIENDSTGGEHNMLTLYLIFDKDFNDFISVKAFDKKGLEIGRSKVFVKGIRDDAKYIDFHFDKRTNIEAKGKLILE